MNSLKNKRFYKVISLFTKAMILLLSFYYIWQKIRTADNAIDFTLLFTSNKRNVFLLVCLMVFLNWGLESLKWKLLIAPLERISFSTSVKSVLAGITISIFTPNRIGEFTGRVFILEKADKIQASLVSMIGSVFQLSITIVAGVLAYFILDPMRYDLFQITSFISAERFFIFILMIVLLIIIFVFVFRKKNTLFVKYKKYLELFSLYSREEIVSVFVLSLIRYMVFATQYYLVLQLFDVHADVTILFSLIALTFFITSAIPTFALTEIAVRGATAVYFFNTIHADPVAVVAASLLLWLINLAFPALIGSLFIGKLKFFKDYN